jgi:hypothetical protein
VQDLGPAEIADVSRERPFCAKLSARPDGPDETPPMLTVLASLHVDSDGRITGRAPPDVPPGNYTAPLQVSAARRPKAGAKLDLPVHDEPWDDEISLRREDLYGEDGR